MGTSNAADQRGTVAQLKADIDSGRTGDKVAFPDPGLAPLGTDDEAAGTSPAPGTVGKVRWQEAAMGEAAASEKPSTPERAWFIPSLLGALLLIVVVAGIIGLMW